jgi:coatomer protein complex subunit alpha (xenin)
VADLVAAGSFELAAQQLKQDLGIVVLGPLKPQFLSLAMGSHAIVPTLAPMPGYMHAMQRDYRSSGADKGSPAVCITLENLAGQVQSGYQAFSKGPAHFVRCMNIFRKVIHSIPFVVCDTRPKVNELKKLQGICREYILGVSIDSKRQETPKDVVRQVELSAYFTHVNLEPMHLILVLRAGMVTAAKAKNFLMAASFAKRLLELNPKADMATQARKVLLAAEQNPANAVSVNYDEHNPFQVCGYSYSPLYRGTPVSKCGYCGASFALEYKGQVCSVCLIGEIGSDPIGLAGRFSRMD